MDENWLLQAFQRRPVAEVSGRQLARALDLLAGYHRSIAFYDPELPSAELWVGLGQSGVLETWNYSHWHEGLGEGVLSLDVPRLPLRGWANCVMCRPPLAQERRLSWAGYEIPPHPKPYEGCAGDQFTVVTPEHSEQRWLSTQQIADMLLLAREAHAGQPLVLFYNGTASNSQDHWHWQILRADLPLQAALEEDRVELHSVFSAPVVEISTYRIGPLSGFYLIGDEAAVADGLGRLVRSCDASSGIPGSWNILIFAPTQGLARAVFVPRRRGTTTVDLGTRGTLWVAAPAVAGRLLSFVDKPEGGHPGDGHRKDGHCKDGHWQWLDIAADEAVRNAIVDPCELLCSEIFPRQVAQAGAALR